MHVCVHVRMYDTDQCHAHSNSLWCVSVCVCMCVFPYNTLCKLFLIGLRSTCVQHIFRFICIM